MINLYMLVVVAVLNGQPVREYRPMGAFETKAACNAVGWDVSTMNQSVNGTPYPFFCVDAASTTSTTKR
jgi:hypothetical protein